MAALTGLRALDLSGNEYMKRTPSVLSQLTALEELYLDCCHLEEPSVLPLGTTRLRVRPSLPHCGRPAASRPVKSARLEGPASAAIERHCRGSPAHVVPGPAQLAETLSTRFAAHPSPPFMCWT